MDGSWTPKPGDRLVRVPRPVGLKVLTFSAENGCKTRRGLSPALIVIYAFVALVLLANLTAQTAIQALFRSVSAFNNAGFSIAPQGGGSARTGP